MKIIEIEIYRCEIELYIGNTTKNISKIIKTHGKKYSESINSFSHGFCFSCQIQKKEENIFIVSMDNKSEAEEIYHESLHLSYYILDYVGIKYNINNHESIAYLQGYIATKIKNEIKKSKRNNNLN